MRFTVVRFLAFFLCLALICLTHFHHRKTSGSISFICIAVFSIFKPAWFLSLWTSRGKKWNWKFVVFPLFQTQLCSSLEETGSKYRGCLHSLNPLRHIFSNSSFSSEREMNMQVGGRPGPTCYSDIPGSVTSVLHHHRTGPHTDPVPRDLLQPCSWQEGCRLSVFGAM